MSDSITHARDDILIPSHNRRHSLPAHAIRTTPLWRYILMDQHYGRVHWEEESGRDIHVDVAEFHRRFLDMVRTDDPQILPFMQQYANERAKLAIFFSNRIEAVGGAVSDTYILLSEILGDTPPPTTTPLSPASHRRVLHNQTRSRQAVLQHGEAYRYLCIEHVDQPLTQDLIKETHRLLMRDVVFENDEKRFVLAGQYRSGPAHAGLHPFMPAAQVPRAMAALCRDFRQTSSPRQRESEEGAEEEEDAQDPYSLAAQLCHDFVCIHPFEDGNGRMCRLLLNYALMHYGIPFPISLGYGVHKGAKAHYLWALRRDERTGGQAKCMAMIVIAGVRAAWERFFTNWRLAVVQPSRSEQRRDSREQ